MHPIDNVREGMNVVDLSDKHVGKVVFVKLGDPDAVTPAGQDDVETPDFLRGFREAFRGSDDVPRERAEELFRVGYIEVDPPGLGRNKYFAAHEIASVDGDTVRISPTD
jgi:hypothetical protein